MKIKHKVPIRHTAGTGDRVDEAYEAEVQITLRRAEARWRSAVKAVERAEHKVQRLERKRWTAEVRAELDRARMALLHRYDELRTIEELMQAAPGACYRERGSVRNPLPKGSKL